MKKLTIAMIAATLTASPALAGDIVAPPQSVTVKVSADGLNLTNARDVAQLQSRVEKAIVVACNPHTSLSVYLGPDRDCANKAMAAGQQIVAKMASDAAKSRMAEF
jgi:UrcA family protein